MREIGIRVPRDGKQDRVLIVEAPNAATAKSMAANESGTERHKLEFVQLTRVKRVRAE